MNEALRDIHIMSITRLCPVFLDTLGWLTLTELVLEEPRSLLDERFEDVCWLACFVMLLLANFVQSMTGFPYIDELVTCCVVAAAIAKVVHSWSKRKIRVSILALISAFSIVALVVLGVFCNYLWGFNKSEFDILIDIFTCLKFPAVLLSSIFLFQGNGRTLLWWIERLIKPLVVVMFLLAVANLFFDFGMGWDGRYGLRSSFMFICGHPEYASLMGVGMAVVFARDLQRNKLYFVLSLLVMALTLRSKSLAFCIVAPAIAYVMRDGRKLNAIHVIICVMVAALIGWDQFVGYYQTDGSARGELTVASVEIAMDHFPLGTGFATFGSNTSASGGYYSPVYYAYELDTVWGLSPENHSFLSDTFWPIVLGQFGFLGLAIYILMLFSVAMLAFREGKATRVCVVLCFTYLIISSTSASSFFNPMSVYLAFLLGLLVAAFRGQNIPSGCEEEPALSTGEDCRV